MRRRLVVSTAVIALAAMLVLGVPLGIIESARVRGDELARLEREADEIAAALDERSEGRPLTPAVLARLLPAGHGASVTRAGRVVRAGLRPGPGTLVARSGASRGVRVAVVASAGEVAARQRRAWLLIGLLAVAGTGAAVALAAVQARRLARPLERLGATSARLGAGDFSARAGPLGVAEFDRVGAALDGAARQIAQLVARQREFTGNVSHQLRSPLTALRLRLEELAEIDDAAAAREEAQAALKVTDRLERTVEELLRLAREGDAGAPRDLDLARVAREHAESWRALYARAGRELELRADESLPARASPGGLAQALDVLLENALRHGTGTTRLEALGGDGRTVLAVADEGRGIPEDLREAIFEPHVSTAGSTGLGLSLARALVEADGGRLVLARGRPPRFEIRVPRPPAAGTRETPSSGR